MQRVPRSDVGGKFRKTMANDNEYYFILLFRTVTIIFNRTTIMGYYIIYKNVHSIREGAKGLNLPHQMKSATTGLF